MSLKYFCFDLKIDPVEQTTISHEYDLMEGLKFQLKHERNELWCTLVVVDQTKIKPFMEVYLRSINIKVLDNIPLELPIPWVSPLDLTWKKIYGHANLPSLYKVTKNGKFLDIGMTIESKKSHTLVKLYEDNETADFEIRATGGNVKIHKIILASASPVFKTMVMEEWRERSDGFVIMKESSVKTLENFKTYLYLGELSNSTNNLDDLKNLLVFSSKYMIEDLEEYCTNIIFLMANKTNVEDITEFSFTNGNQKLTKLILDKWDNRN